METSSKVQNCAMNIHVMTSPVGETNTAGPFSYPPQKYRHTSSRKVGDLVSGRKSCGCQQSFTSFKMGRTVFSMYPSRDWTSSNRSLVRL
jgi:hypothetical protein